MVERWQLVIDLAGIETHDSNVTITTLNSVHSAGSLILPTSPQKMGISQPKILIVPRLRNPNLNRDF